MTPALRRLRELGLRRSAPMLLHLARQQIERPVRIRRARSGVYRIDPAEALRAARAPTAADAFIRSWDALPSVRRASDATLGSTARARVTRLAERQFDLLGSGPVRFGSSIDWHRDPVSGVTWPLEHFSSLILIPHPGADVKWPWELSRCQHLPLLALAFREGRDRRLLDEIGRQIVEWRASNPVELGINWRCTMDVGIRGANWVAALALLAEAGVDEPWFGDALSSVLEHARFIRRTLEFGVVRGNHYLADIVGLLVCCTPFAEAEGKAVTFAVRALQVEVRSQLGADGCGREASIAYHRLVTELFVLGRDVAEHLRPGSTTPDLDERVARAVGFAEAITRPDQLAPVVGDADDGRVLPLADYGEDPRSIRHLFEDASRRSIQTEVPGRYPNGGFWILRDGSLYVLVRCGDVGMEGLGSHAHNDQLALEICLGEQPIVVDPGSFVYTRDSEARNYFRSTARHATIRLARQEQSPLDRLFGLEDRAKATCTEFTATRFVGRHRAYAPAICTRVVQISGGGTEHVVHVLDTVEGVDGAPLDWSFPLAPGASLDVTESGVTARWPAVTARFEGATADWAIEDGWYSPRYGVRHETKIIKASRAFAKDGEFTIRLSETAVRRACARDARATDEDPTRSGE